METGVGPPSENVFGMVEAANTVTVAQIKQEASETDQTVTDSDNFHQTFPPSTTLSNGPEGQIMFSAYSDSLNNDVSSNFSTDATSLPAVHFEHHQPCGSSFRQPNGSISVSPCISVKASDLNNPDPSTADLDNHRTFSQAGTPALCSNSHEQGKDCSVDSVKGTRTRSRAAHSNTGQQVQNHVRKSSSARRVSDSANTTAPSIKQKRVARGLVDRMEKTTRRLRVRQSAQLQDNFYNEQTQGSEEPASAQTEDKAQMPPPAKELKPRRMKRKPNHTQRVWRLNIVEDAFDKWRHIGDSKGLSTDTEIAVFLMEHYENVLSGQPTGAMCLTCHSALTFACLVCQTPSQLKQMSVDSLTSQSRHNSEQSNHHSNGVGEAPAPVSADCSNGSGGDSNGGEGEVVAKLEPEETVSDGETGAEPPEDLPEEDVGSPEEEKKKKGKRKRGRPVGSGKQQVVGTVLIKPSKLKARKYRCTHEGCEAAFSKSSRLKIHNRIHTGERPYVCKECDRAFTQNSGLKVHMQKHTGLRPYTCAECGSSFPSSSTLKQHMRRHTGEKPFHCKKCDKTFRWSGHLTQHMRMHDGIKPFLCPDCGKSFSASSDLVKHKVTHTKDRPYKCDLCDKAYSFQHRLTAHQRSHTGDRPFLCSLCGSAFARAHNLTVHYRTHTGDKPYWCKDCGAKFSDSGNFSKHKKTKHGPTSKGISIKNVLYSVAEDEEQEDITGLASNNSVDTMTTATDRSSSDLPLLRLPDFGHMASMAKMAEYVKREAGGKLPSMAKMAGLADDENSFLTVGGVRCGGGGGGGVATTTMSRPHSLPSVSTLATTASSSSSSPNQHLYLQTSPSLSERGDLNLKNLLPSLGDHDNDQTLSALPSHLPVDSATLQPSVPSPSAPSPNPNQVPPGPSGSGNSGDNGASPMPQPAHQTQTDGVVFPPQYYGTYPYYYQQQ